MENKNIYPGDANNIARVSQRCKCATVRLHNVFQRLRKVGVFYCKNAQFINFLTFFLNPACIFYVMGRFVCATILGRHLGRAKKLSQSMNFAWILSRGIPYDTNPLVVTLMSFSFQSQFSCWSQIQFQLWVCFSTKQNVVSILCAVFYIFYQSTNI